MKNRKLRWLITQAPDARAFVVYTRSAKAARRLTGCLGPEYQVTPAGFYDARRNTIRDDPDDPMTWDRGPSRAAARAPARRGHATRTAGHPESIGPTRVSQGPSTGQVSGARTETHVNGVNGVANGAGQR